MKDKRIILYLALLFLAIFLMIMLKHNSEKNSQEEADIVHRDYAAIKKDGTLRILSSYNAGEFDASSDTVTGSVYNLARELSNQSGLKVNVILENHWEKSLNMLEHGEVDLIANPVVQTSETDSSKFRFLETYSIGKLLLVQKKGKNNKIMNQLDLAGDTVTLPAGTPEKLFLTHLSEEIGDTIHIKIDPKYSTEQLAIMVSAEVIPYTVCNDKDAQYLSKQLPDLDFSVPVSYDMREAWLVRKDSKVLADSLNKWIKIINTKNRKELNKTKNK